MLVLCSSTVKGQRNCTGPIKMPEYYLYPSTKIIGNGDERLQQAAEITTVEWVKNSSDRLIPGTYLVFWNPGIRSRINGVIAVRNTRQVGESCLGMFSDNLIHPNTGVELDQSLYNSLQARSTTIDGEPQTNDGEHVVEYRFPLTFEPYLGQTIDEAKAVFESKPSIYKEQFRQMLSRFSADQNLIIEVCGSASPDGNSSNNQVIALNRTATGIHLFKDLYDDYQNNSTLNIITSTNAAPIYPPGPYPTPPDKLEITVTGSDRPRVLFRSKGITNNDTDNNSYVMDRGIFFRLYTRP